ncbi:peptide ABC transporter substrate-binding protein [Microlunatus elymi]|nr:ABC transporter substrate-binding protein [Microlunatus elymi]
MVPRSLALRGLPAVSAAKKLMAVGAVVALLSTAACTSGGGSDNNNDNAGGGGGTKTVHLALGQDVDSMLPMDAHVGDNIGVLSVVFDALVRYDAKTGKPYNYVADKIDTTDNKVWTIKIKPGLKFQNGDPVDAASFARAWNYAAYGPHAMYNNYFFDRIAGYDEMQGEYTEDDDGKVTVTKKPKATELSGLKVVDDTTLQVTLTSPFAGFSTMLGYTGFYPVTQSCIDDIKACAKKPIGNGPFKIDSWDQGVQLTASKWKGYSLKETPNYDKIVWKEYAGSSSWPDFEAGDLDLGAPPPDQWQAANNDPDLTSRKVERQTADLTYLGFPLYKKNEPWDNIEFRKAISMAIDRQKIIDTVIPGQSVPATSWVPVGIPGGRDNVCQWCKYDPQAAKAALAKAGGWPQGKVLNIYLGKDETSEAYFKAIGDQISLNLGIKYKLIPSTDFFSLRSARKFDGAYRNNWFPDYPLNENFLGPVYSSDDPKNGNTEFGYYDAAFEKALKDGDAAPDIDSAVTDYEKAEDILAKDFPTIPLDFSKSVTFYSDRVDNIVIDPFSGATRLRELKYVG